MYLDRRGNRGELDLHLSTEHGCKCRSVTAIRHVDQIDASHYLEQFPGEMGYAPGSGRGHVDLAWIGFGVSDELGDRFSRNGWNDHHDLGTAGDARDRRDVADEIEIELLVKRVCK
jgi:hypothetical protein